MRSCRWGELGVFWLGLSRKFLATAFLCLAAVYPKPSSAGDDLLSGRLEENLLYALMLRDVCVGTFPRFRTAASVLDSKSNFRRRAGQPVWDHVGVAVTMSLPRIDGKPACVMTALARDWDPGAWASFAVPAFGATWESDQTVVSPGPGAAGDEFRQHIIVRFPTGETFAFDADRRPGGVWLYTISLVAG
jgi:hypothetical protein